MIIPKWSIPKNVRAFTSLREDPHFEPPFSLDQVHQNQVVLLPYPGNVWPKADAAVTRTPNIICSVRTADCLPILVTNQQGREVAAIHAGWKGLAAGVIEATFKKMYSEGKDCIAWIGPAICGQCYEVGPEFPLPKEYRDGHYFANLPQIAEKILQDLGVTQICQSSICTMEEERCCSYRRQNGSDQRMITAISFS